MTAIVQLRKAWSEAVSGPEQRADLLLARVVDGLGARQVEVRDQPVARIEGQPEPPGGRPPERRSRGAKERSVSVARDLPEARGVDRLAEVGAATLRGRAPGSRLRLRARHGPDFFDLAVVADPVEVEARDGEDLGGGGEGVLQDLAKVRRLAEEVSALLAGREARRRASLHARAERERGRRAARTRAGRGRERSRAADGKQPAFSVEAIAGAGRSRRPKEKAPSPGPFEPAKRELRGFLLLGRGRRRRLGVGRGRRATRRRGRRHGGRRHRRRGRRAVVVVVVPVAVVPVSSTTVGCSVVVVVSVVVSSFFLQPVTSAVANTATRPRVTSFFISLISFSLTASFSRKKNPRKKRARNDTPTDPSVNWRPGPARRAVPRPVFLRFPRQLEARPTGG